MVSVENVTVVSISTFDELKSIIQKGSEQRHTSGTQMNDESSRSHLILSIVIESTNLQTQSVARGKVFHYQLEFYLRIYDEICFYALWLWGIFMVVHLLSLALLSHSMKKHEFNC